MKQRSIPPSPADRFFHGYELLELFKTGGMSQAFKARRIDSGETVFLKRVRTRSEKDRHALDREMQIYEKLRGQPCVHVLRILDVIAADDYRAIVTEFADGGDLNEFVRANGHGGGLPAHVVKVTAAELAGALQELHDYDVVHRDLKPANVLSAGGHIKLSDFGIAKHTARMHAKISFKQFGSPGYAAPEQLAGAPAHPSADVYSFGMMLAFLLTGQPRPDAIASVPWRRLALACTENAPELRPAAAPLVEELARMPG